MKLDNNNHSVFLLNYQLIMCTKHRNKMIDDAISNRLREMFENLSIKYNISEISKFINAYKSASSRLIKKEFPEIRKSLWKEMFWSPSFCLLTTGGATIEIIQQYIQSQGGKDGKQSNKVQTVSKR